MTHIKLQHGNPVRVNGESAAGDWALNGSGYLAGPQRQDGDRSPRFAVVFWFGGNALMLVALLVAANVIADRVLPFGFGDPEFRAKYAYYSDYRDQIDLVFIGSSRVGLHVVPSVFDRVVSDRIAIRSFNFGLNGLTFERTHALFRKLMAGRKASKPCYVLVELHAGRYAPSGSQLYMLNSVQWYTPAYTWGVVRDLWADQSNSMGVCLRSTGIAVEIMIKRVFHIGMGKELWNHWQKRFYGARRYTAEGINMAETQGFVSRDSQLARYGRVSWLERHWQLMEHPEILHEVRSRCTLEGQPAERASPGDYRRLQDMIDLGSKAGAKVLFFLPPLFESGASALYHAAPSNLRLQAGDAATFPEFYEMQSIFDSGHLNESGATAFTAVLGREFLDAVGSAKTR